MITGLISVNSVELSPLDDDDSSNLWRSFVVKHCRKKIVTELGTMQLLDLAKIGL